VSPLERVKSHSMAIAACAAAAHLAAVIFGAVRFSVPGSSIPGKIFEVYAAYSGANNSYGFFAPGVAAQWRAAIDFYDPAHGTWTTGTRSAANLELAVLDSTINSLFSRDELREALAASWAGAAMPERPEAAVVLVRAEAFRVPTMEQYRKGARGEWLTLAAYAFTTDDRMTLMDARNSGATPR
jgi:hypothetical protein